MAQYSMTTSTVQRSAGSSVVAHAAYISGTCLVDARTGKTADYTRRSGVECVADEIVLPSDEIDAQSAKIERGQLWDMAEAAEKRKDGNPARKVLVALPHELEPADRLALTKEYAQWMADRYHVAVDYAIHKPDEKGDQRNFHAHMLLTTREIHSGKLTDKAKLEWNGAALKKEGLPGGKAMIRELRERWEVVQNDALARHAPEAEQVSCKRLSVQREAKLQESERLQKEATEIRQKEGGSEVDEQTANLMIAEARLAKMKAAELDRTAQMHVGWQASAMERRLEQEKDRRTKKQESTENLPTFATEHGAQRSKIQQEQQGMFAQLRERIAGIIERVRARLERARAVEAAEMEAFKTRFGQRFKERSAKLADVYMAQVVPGLRRAGKHSDADLLEKYGPKEIQRKRQVEQVQKHEREKKRTLQPQQKSKVIEGLEIGD